MRKVLAHLAIAFALVACSTDDNNDNTPATFSGDDSASIEADSSGASGTIVITDPDSGEDAFNPQTNVTTNYGSFSMDAEGNWTYSLDISNDEVMILASDDSLTEDIAVTSVDGTQLMIIIVINGLHINTPATISGDMSASIASDAANSVTGTLTVTDPDEGESGIVEFTSSSDYGTLTVTAAGDWSYALDATNTEVSGLMVGSTLTDIFPITSIDGTSGTITITIEGTVPQPNVAAVFTGALTGTVAYDDSTALVGSVTVMDSNPGENTLIEATNVSTAYGTFSISTNGDWIYVLDVANTDVAGLSGDATLTDTISISSFDGTMDNIVITITGPDAVANTPATFSGDLAVTVIHTTATPVTGTVVVTDTDAGQALIEVESDLITTYGTFSITEAGVWSYLLDTSNSTVAGLLDSSDTVADIIEITSVDGTVASLVITITGVDSQALTKTKVATITDSMDNDAGELRYKVSSDILAGKLKVSFLREDGIETADGISKDGFISLYGDSTSSNDAIIDLRVKSDSYSIRNKDDIIILPSVNLDKWTDVEITWDATSASDTVAPLVTVAIDGVQITDSAFSSAAVQLDKVKTGVKYVIFKVGDTTAVIPTGNFLFDDLVLYSDLAGNTIQFQDDFESYSVGDSLDTDNPASPYHSSTADASVTEVDVPADENVSSDNHVAAITDSMDNDAGELRYKVSSDIVAGKLTISYLRQTGVETADGISKDGFISIFGDSTSSNDAILDLRIKSSVYSIRNKDDITIAQTVVEDKWTDIEITWDATSASDTVAPLVTLAIDGVAITDSAFSSAAVQLDKVKTGVKYVIFKVGDTTAVIPSGAFWFDDLILYSDLAGSTIQFQDDFESYAEGASLDTDNAASPYHSSTADATVVKE